MLDLANKIVAAELGKIHIFSVGQAGFIIKSSSGQLLGIDLYLSECVERIEGNDGYKRMLPCILEPCELRFDAIIATHYHRDHFDVDSMPVLMENKKTKLYAAFDCQKDVNDLRIGADQVEYVKPGAHAVYGDFILDFVKCDHGKGAPEAVGVIVSVDEKKIYETGDTCLHTEWADELPCDIDILIAPINGAFGNLNEIECVKYSQAIKPKLTIPCHYGMFASHGGNPGIFHDAMNEMNLPYLIMTMGEQYTIDGNNSKKEG